MSEVVGMARSDGGDYRVIKLVKRLLKEEVYPRWRGFLAVILLIFLAAGVNVIVTPFIKNVFDELARVDMTRVVGYSTLLSASFLLLAALGYLSSLILAKLEFGIICLASGKDFRPHS